MMLDKVGSFRLLLLYAVLNLTKSCSKKMPESFRMVGNDVGEGRGDSRLSVGFILITIGLMMWKGSLPTSHLYDE